MTPAIHAAMTHDALGALLGADALAQVVAANTRSDLYQFSPWRHFDNGADRVALCALWRRGLGAYMRQVVLRCSPRDAQARWLRDRRGALTTFGAATHALQDFYSHTNWIELLLAQGQLTTSELARPTTGDATTTGLLAPLLGYDCQPDDLPPELQSGYFNLRNGATGCPWRDGKPEAPRGYGFCHETLNKDTPMRGHGAERATADGATYHTLARRLATAATRDAWTTLGRRLVDTYGADIAPRIIAALT